MLWIEIEAPFAAVRPFIAGVYRPTAGFLSHSTVYGLLLNLGGVEYESRLPEHEPTHSGKVPASLLRDGLPSFRLALGLPAEAQPPRVQSIYQQLHNYPLMANFGLPFELAKGRKNNIQPARREILCDVKALVVVQDADESFEGAILRGLDGSTPPPRYGLPFLGDNNFLIDRIEPIDPRPARWYSLVAERSGRPRAGTNRLTAYIDRTGMTGTRSALFAPEDQPSDIPPSSACVPVGAPSEFDDWFKHHSSS